GLEYRLQPVWVREDRLKAVLQRRRAHPAPLAPSDTFASPPLTWSHGRPLPGGAGSRSITDVTARPPACLPLCREARMLRRCLVSSAVASVALTALALLIWDARAQKQKADV